VRHDNPPASDVAAAKVKPSHQSRLQVIAAIVDAAGYYGATADEIWLQRVAVDPKATRSTWHSAVSAAAKEGLIVPFGPKHVRMSVNNSPMTIYITEGNRRA
jgi:hypothetical protein